MVEEYLIRLDTTGTMLYIVMPPSPVVVPAFLPLAADVPVDGSYGTTMSTSGESIADFASESTTLFPGRPMWLGIQQIVISLFRMSLISSRISMRMLGLLVDCSDWMA